MINMPTSNSNVAGALIEEVFKEREYPVSPQAAGRCGWEAAVRYLKWLNDFNPNGQEPLHWPNN